MGIEFEGMFLFFLWIMVFKPVIYWASCFWIPKPSEAAPSEEPDSFASASMFLEQ